MGKKPINSLKKEMSACWKLIFSVLSVLDTTSCVVTFPRRLMYQTGRYIFNAMIIGVERTVSKTSCRKFWFYERRRFQCKVLRG
uniref:Uncharacterized protein n=1 Tax=Arundo donax TaxID=35708 RepID=A0A0A9EDQ6_ARUDO